MEDLTFRWAISGAPSAETPTAAAELIIILLPLDGNPGQQAKPARMSGWQGRYQRVIQGLLRPR